jgi:UDP-3-O-[3-hydroxymyristoyl] glucosamine N-acyltransferase
MNPSVSVDTIQKRFPDLLNGDVKNSETLITNMTPPEQAVEGSLVFITDLKLLEAAIKSPAACFVVSHSAKPTIESHQSTSQNFLFSKNVKLAMALVKTEFFSYEIPLQKNGSIHPSAVIDPTAIIGQNVSIGAYTVIGANVVIGENVRIDPLVTIEADCKIGKDSHLFPHLYIGPRTEIGERCSLLPNSTIGSEGFGFAHDERGRFFRIPQTGKVVLHNDVEIGANSTVDRATFGVTTIGEGTKIDKQAHISHNCEIGSHCVLAGSFAVAGSTKIGNHFISGGRVTVKDNITITDGVEVAGLSAVHGSITSPGQYGGHPTLPVRDSMRTIMTLPHLPKMRKDINKILKHLELDKEN